MTDDTLRLTYHIEVDLRALRAFRMWRAVAFTDAAKALIAFDERPAPKFWALAFGDWRPARRRWLWAQMRNRRADYDCACRAVEALERHDPDSHLLDDVTDFMADAERQRRMAQRSREDEASFEPGVISRAILREMREVRDKVDPPVPRGGDYIHARRQMNSLRDGTV